MLKAAVEIIMRGEHDVHLISPDTVDPNEIRAELRKIAGIDGSPNDRHIYGHSVSIAKYRQFAALISAKKGADQEMVRLDEIIDLLNAPI